MDLSGLKDWAWLISLALSSLVVPAALYWGGRNFATKAEHQNLTDRVSRAETRLNDGEQRFIRVEAAIREVTHAADDARAAAMKATDAAEKIGDIRVSLAELAGEIRLCNALLKRVEKDADRLIDGHLDTGDTP